MTDDLIEYLDVERLMQVRHAQIVELVEKIEWLEDKLARIQYTNLRRDINIETRTTEIDRMCKERKADD